MSAHHTGAEWKRVLARVKPIFEAQVKAGTASCVNCTRQILPTHTWQVGHRVDVALALRLGWSRPQIDSIANLGPTHTRCNLSAGGTLGARIRNSNQRTRQGLPNWRDV